MMAALPTAVSNVPLAKPLRIERIAAERQVGDFTGCAARAAQQLSIGDDSQANTGAEGDEGEDAARRAPCPASARRALRG